MSNMINWYPGHMKKTKDMIIENLKIVDVVIEILDARIPLSSKNPDIDNMLKNKTRIVILNKCDLVDEKELNKWKEYFLNNEISSYFLPLSVEKNKNFSELKKIITDIYQNKLERMLKKGLRKTTLRAMVVGIPNVGKSKFINKFSNKNKAKVGNIAGFTRGKQWVVANDKFELLDMPGVLWPKFENERVAFNLAITGSIRDNVLPLEKVANEFLNILKRQDKINDLIRVYKLEIDDLSKLKNEEIFSILEKRLGIHKNTIDFEMISQRLLKEYRMAKIGKYILEFPEDIKKEGINEF